MILVTGATGHTGGHVMRQLLDRYPGTPIRCFVRTTSDVKPLARFPVLLLEGDLRSEADVAEAMIGVRIVVHIANIRFSPTITKEAIAHGVEQIVMVHTTGMFSKYREYAAHYLRIEQAVVELCKAHQVTYTILRPTMIYGGKQDHNFHKLIRVLHQVPLFPLFGDGSSKMRPVHAEDLASAIVSAVDNPQAGNQAFNISGGSSHTYLEILRMVTGLLNRRVLFVRVPLAAVVWFVGLLCRLRLSPISVEQVRRLVEDKAFDHDLARQLLNYHPRDLETGLRQEIHEMGVR